MAIFAPFAQLSAQAANDPRFTAAFAYVHALLAPGSEGRARIGAIEVGSSKKIDLAGGAFAIEQVYNTKQRPDGFFESHRNYIDVQVIVEGEELMEVEDIARLTVTQPFIEDRDFIKYAHTDLASVLKVRAGDATIFFPEDGHMPSLQWKGPGVVRKTVVKVPVA
ncbi:YhcH/YjgK/YiaL family protein [Oleiharenicola lentus]|uniref:YhcH/YjgK/YiaL family protein n=1 Tax=Oleiharenicola lentus TaxID=2508720 RepID=UPI003F66DC50